VLLDVCFVLFIFGLTTCVCVCLQVQGPLRECFGQVLPGFLITAHRCISDVIGVLTDTVAAKH